MLSFPSAASAFAGSRLLLLLAITVDPGKLIDRERKRTEETAGIVLFRFHTLFVRYCEIGAVDQDLCGTNDADHREYTQRNKQPIPTRRVNQFAGEARIDGFRDLGAATAGVSAFTVAVYDL